VGNTRDTYADFQQTFLGAIAIAATGIRLASSAVAAETPSMLTDSIKMALGTFILATESSIQPHGDAGIGDEVDLDEALVGGVADRIRDIEARPDTYTQSRGPQPRNVGLGNLRPDRSRR
jgi:hypothetical protein